MNIENKIELINKTLGTGVHTVEIETERIENPLLKRGFFDEFGFSTDNCVKTSKFTGICGGGCDYVALYRENMKTPFERSGKKVHVVNEQIIIPNLIKKNNNTGNVLMTVYGIKGKHKSEVSWSLPGKEWFNPSDEKYTSFWRSAPKKEMIKGDNLKVMKTNVDNIKSLVVDGVKVW